MMTDDMELVREYTAHQSELAFETLVARYVNLVYSTALRRVNDPHLAEEVTQAVFIILARKAGSLGPKTILPSWLHRAGCFVAADVLRGERRRARREQEALMQSLINEPSPAVDDTWRQIAPLLDTAIAGLNEKDRHAIVLRFFENRSLGEVGRAVGGNEDTARMRVNRALEKLRRYFFRRGVSSTTAIIAQAISANSVQIAPVALAKAVTAVAVAKGVAASGSTLTYIKGALKLMAWTKAKAVIVASAALLLATGTTVVVVEKILPTTVDESFCAMKVENLDKAPPVLIIRPPRYKDRGMMSQSSDNNSKIYRKVIAHNMDIKGLVWCAYSPSPQRMIMPADAPTKLFDLMLTLRSHSNEALQKAIKEKFGITAKRETRETDVLVLQIKDSGLLAGHVSQGRGRVGFKYENGLAAWSNAPISKIADFLEHTFDKPVIVQSDLTGKYDITFQWEQGQNERRALSDELAQAGLELVPDREPIEMLVVEKH